MPPKRTPLRAIRNKCLECSGGDKQEVHDCMLEHCPLFPYRLGIDPYAPLALPDKGEKPELPTSDSRRPAGDEVKQRKGQDQATDQHTLF